MGSANAARSGLRARSRPSLRRSKKSAPAHQTLGLRERKKARLRQQIVETAVRLFRKRGYENTRVEDIVSILEISQPTFFRYFPSKDAVLRDVGKRGFACIVEHLKSELSSEADTGARLSHLYRALAREVEADRPLWQAVVLSGWRRPNCLSQCQRNQAQPGRSAVFVGKAYRCR